MTKGREKYSETSQVLFCHAHIKYPFITCQAVWHQTLQEVAHDTSTAQVQTTTSLSLIFSSSIAPSLPSSSQGGGKKTQQPRPCTSAEKPFMGMTGIQKTSGGGLTGIQKTPHQSPQPSLTSKSKNSKISVIWDFTPECHNQVQWNSMRRLGPREMFMSIFVALPAGQSSSKSLF